MLNYEIALCPEKPVISIITKDGVSKGYVFNEMLRSTLQIPYDEIILIDDSDSANTALAVKKFAEENGKKLTAFKSNLYGYTRATRATARQTAIDIFLKNYDSDFLIQLDDDVVLRKGWWEEANKLISKPTTGLFYGIPYDVSTENEFNELLRSDIPFRINEKNIRNFYERGGTNDIILTRKSLTKIKESFGIIPPDLHIYEDAWILRAVKCAGFDVEIGYVGALQFDPIKNTRSIDSTTFDVDLKHILIASKYGIIKSAKPFNDALGLFAPIIGLLPWIFKYASELGFRKGVRVAAKRQYIKIVYRWVKLSSMRKGCTDLIYKPA